MIRAELEDGRILEFPDDTEDSVIDAAVKKEMGLAEEVVNPPAIGGMTNAPVLTDTPTPPGQPSRLEGLISQIPQVGGGMAGGLAMAKKAIQVGKTVGSLAEVGTMGLAVAVGAGGGEAYKQIGQHLSGSLDAPKTSLDSAKRIAKAAYTEGGFELVGGLLAKGLGKILAPFKEKMIEGSVSAIDFFDDKVKPVVFLPAEATETRILDLMQNVAESSILGGGKIQAFKGNRLKFFDDFADSLIREFGERTDPTELGDLFVTTVTEAKKVHSKTAKILYNGVKAGNVRIPTKSLKTFASPIQKRAAKLGGIEAKNAGDDLMDAIMDLPDTLSYKEATELRSRLISRADEFSVMNKKAPVIGKTKKLVERLDDQISRGLKGLPAVDGETPYEAWRAANKFYREGQKDLNNAIVRRLVKMADDNGVGAEMIAPSVFKPGHVTVVRQVKKAMEGDPKSWRKMQGFFMQHLLSKSANAEGDIVGNKLLNHMSGKPGSFGLPMLKEVFTDAQIDSLQMLGRALKLTQERQAEGAGRVLIQLTQAGALGTLLTGNFALPAATIIIAPAVMSKMMLNPITAKILTQGIEMGQAFPEAAGIMVRLVAAAERAKEE
jgi:hypothetical protein